MKTTKLVITSAAAVVCGLMSASAQSISVAGFGAGGTLSGFQEKNPDQTFPTGTPPNWTVTSSTPTSDPNYSPTAIANAGVNWVGTVGTGSIPTPDGNNSVNMDGSATGENGKPGQMFTTISVPHSGIVAVSFYLAGVPGTDSTDSAIKTLGVQLGTSLIGAATSPAQISTFNTTGHTTASAASMGWVLVTDDFNVAAGGTYYLLFSSLDTNAVNGGPVFSPGPDLGAEVDDVTASEGNPPPGVPDNGSTLVLLGLGIGASLMVSRRMTKTA